MTGSKEDYLKCIYKLSKSGIVSNKSICEALNVKAASVSDMLRKFNDLGYTRVEGREIILTDLGKKEAILTIRKHRVWEIFLYNILKIDLLKVHEEAEQLEHATSPFLLKKLEDYLFSPGQKLELEDELIYLSECNIKDKLIIIGYDKINMIENYLYKKGINFKMIYEVVEKDSFSNEYILKSSNGDLITLIDKAAQVIEVYKLKEK